MAKRILSVLLCAVMLVSFSGCSPAETISGWLDEASGLIPNDVEMIISQILGTETETEAHEIYFSEGYVNMLKNGTYYMTYVLSDGTEVMQGSNGLRSGSSYPEPAELKNTEPQYDENGNEIEGDFHFYTTTPDVVSVSENGDVTGLNGGTAYVYAAEYTTGKIVRLTVAVTLTTIIGDANIDDTINSLDILLVQQHILGYTELTGVSWHNCDIDGDLALDAIDLSMLQMMILGLA